MVSMSSAQPVTQDAKHSASLSISELLLVLVGLASVVLSVILPLLMRGVIEHGGGGVTFRSGYLRVLTPFITNVSMASAFVVAVVILSFDKSKANAVSALFGILTLAVSSAEISLSFYLSLSLPLTANAPMMEIYLIGLVPLGLGCTMFTLAAIMSSR
ncbi:MAG: hypothetical protein ABSA92_02350 [Candidatus Bathyarchaeia archaeon]